MKKKNNERGSYAIGGGVLIGIGVGSFFLSISALYFIGCIMAGLGLGLIISSLISNENCDKK